MHAARILLPGWIFRRTDRYWTEPHHVDRRRTDRQTGRPTDRQTGRRSQTTGPLPGLQPLVAGTGGALAHLNPIFTLAVETTAPVSEMVGLRYSAHGRK
jgi:hypothetical protein